MWAPRRRMPVPQRSLVAESWTCARNPGMAEVPGGPAHGQVSGENWVTPRRAAWQPQPAPLPAAVARVPLRARAGRAAPQPDLPRRGVPPGEGRPVLLIPGFLAGDGSLGTMTHWLRAPATTRAAPGSAPTSAAPRRPARGWRRGWRASPSTSGEPVTIIGQSRGGTFARALAVRRPGPRGGHRHARLADGRAAAHPPARARPGRPRLGARQRAGARAVLAGAACAATAATGSAPRSPARSRTRSGYMAMYSRTRRGRRLALVPGPGRRAGRGPLLALRHGASARRSTARSAARSARSPPPTPAGPRPRRLSPSDRRHVVSARGRLDGKLELDDVCSPASSTALGEEVRGRSAPWAR